MTDSERKKKAPGVRQASNLDVCCIGSLLSLFLFFLLDGIGFLLAGTGFLLAGIGFLLAWFFSDIQSGVQARRVSKHRQGKAFRNSQPSHFMLTIFKEKSMAPRLSQKTRNSAQRQTMPSPPSYEKLDDSLLQLDVQAWAPHKFLRPFSFQCELRSPAIRQTSPAAKS